MYKVLLADDSYEDRELLKQEIGKALEGVEDNIHFTEAASVRQAAGLLASDSFDLMTLDIEFDRMNEGIEALPDFFDKFPSLNIIIVSGKLNKAEVTEELFRFTKDNVLKGKRWARHFDVLDKKDGKAESIRSAHAFATERKGSADKVKDMLSLAETYLEKGEHEKCLETYKKIQEIYPDEPESRENIKTFSKGGYEQALDYLHKGEKVVAALLLGHHIESRLKAFTRNKLGRYYPSLYDCLRELEKARRIKPFKRTLFQGLLRVRNKSMHHPGSLSGQDFNNAVRDLKQLESAF
jgi:CheY-like chemotaxis protein